MKNRKSKIFMKPIVFFIYIEENKNAYYHKYQFEFHWLVSNKNSLYRSKVKIGIHKLLFNHLSKHFYIRNLHKYSFKVNQHEFIAMLKANSKFVYKIFIRRPRKDCKLILQKDYIHNLTLMKYLTAEWAFRILCSNNLLQERPSKS